MKYISLEHHDGTTKAFSAEEFNDSTLDEAHCWIWQDAETREEAIDSHMEKYTEWEDDVNAGREPKDIY